MRRRLLQLATFILAVLTVCSCAPAMSEEEMRAYMTEAGEQLMAILWNVDYRTFTPDETTAYAQRYYDSEYLADYMEDVEGKSGLYSAQEEKLITRLNSTRVLGFDTAVLGPEGEEIEYRVLRIQADMTMENYEPLYPDDSFFEDGRDYVLNYNLYFMPEDGTLKLSGFDFEPVGEPFLPKRANNKTLTAEEQAEISRITNEYYDVRYAFTFESFDPEAAYAFYERSMSADLLEREGITLEYLQGFKEDITALSLSSSIERLDLGDLPTDKESVRVDEMYTEFFYVVHASMTYSITASEAYYEQSGLTPGVPSSFNELIAFDFVDGELKIVYAAFE